MSLTLTVIGTGYLGATHAACMAELGHTVIGLDVDAARVEALSSGRLPFFEPELEPLLRRHLASGRLRFTTSVEEVAAAGDVHFLCVGTPQRTSGLAADVSDVIESVDKLAPHLDRPCLLVGKSTVPVGTASALAARVAERAPAGADVEVAWNPEFLRESSAVQDTLSPDRLVAGVAGPTGEKMLREVYSQLLDRGITMLVTDPATAELTKVASNAFLATKISFINAMAEVCEAAGADICELAEAMALDPRIGGQFLAPGLGFGGGCLPKDIRAFMARAAEIGAEGVPGLLREVDAINVRQRQRTVALAREELGGSIVGASIAVLGAAFKPNSDDVRDSPALNVAASLHLQGGHVRVYDPEATENARQVFPTLAYTGSVQECCRGADIVLHLTEWPEFADIDPDHLGRIAPARRIIDARNALEAEDWRAAGWSYRALGRPMPGRRRQELLRS
jgi:UDPglucose 6-dehydrogenase